MDIGERSLHISGMTPLKGQMHINPAKNSTLFLMLGSLLTREKVILQDIPKLSDVLVMADMLKHFGAEVQWHGKDLHIQADELVTSVAPYHLVSKMRASFVAMGALVARCGSARMSMPGGCAFGPRPVDLHIKAFKALGAEVVEESGDFFVEAKTALKGKVVFDFPTVGGTENVILASALGSTSVVIENAAREPEISDLAAMLNQMGAKIQGAGTSRIHIQGVPNLQGITYRPIPDRIEAGTFMLAVAATRGEVVFKDVNAEQLSTVVAKLNEAGVKTLELDKRSLLVDATGTLSSVDIEAEVYPGFPTDLQAPFGAFLSTVEGKSTIIDHVYSGRFTHINELSKAGLAYDLDNQVLNIYGSKLKAATMHAADIRAGGALVVAALAAEGTSVITGLDYIERGYEAIAERLRGIGANIRVVNKPALATGTFGD